MRWMVYVVVLLAAAIFATSYHLPNVCDAPQPYSIGFIDSRFNLSKAEVETSVAKAVASWEQSSGIDLFNYNPTAKNPITIRMVYDERQAVTSQVNTERSGVTTEKTSLQEKIADFNQRSRALDAKVSAFNAKIQSWNKKQDQTEDEYNKLIEEQATLQQETNALNAEAQTLQQDTNAVNGKIDQLNTNIGTLQTIVTAKPEEGLYESATKTISIYYSVDQDELVHTIAHELGHAVGLDHIANPKSIMYVQVNDTLTPTKDDIAALNRICKRETPLERVQNKEWQQRILKLFHDILPI